MVVQLGLCLDLNGNLRESQAVSRFPYGMALIMGVKEISRRIRKPTICICENNGADQLSGNHEADQRFCFRYTVCTIPLLLKSKLSSF